MFSGIISRNTCSNGVYRRWHTVVLSLFYRPVDGFEVSREICCSGVSNRYCTGFKQI